MKAVPILIVTNALALGLVIMLYVKQDELSSKVDSRRSNSTARDAGEDTSDLRAEVANLKRMLNERGMNVPAPAEEMPERDTVDAGGGDATATPGEGTDAPDGVTLSGEAMESFRKNVRKALELNRDEDQVNRIADSLDELVKDNKIGPLTDKQKKRVAEAMLAYRERMPEIWRKMRTEMEGLSREERGQVMRESFENLRAEVQTDLEGIVPAADAKTIVDSTGRGMGRWGRGPRGRGDR